ncbi:MAG: hypothetical protein AVDCRST_MAG96-2613 [uncultured Segetibacter sp.]|uniref:Uncharacterized protein n=1 Tax=uncultured Segetibacter sp. TaxID=481133 RepID=A0A6J4T6G9_9BACT|nr:MAG: hypothetical protein AVDCRST_MAG96-2613 [uncultured Segetibacter sp.]
MIAIFGGKGARQRVKGKRKKAKFGVEVGSYVLVVFLFNFVISQTV